MTNKSQYHNLSSVKHLRLQCSFLERNWYMPSFRRSQSNFPPSSSHNSLHCYLADEYLPHILCMQLRRKQSKSRSSNLNTRIARYFQRRFQLRKPHSLMILHSID